MSILRLFLNIANLLQLPVVIAIFVSLTGFAQASMEPAETEAGIEAEIGAGDVSELAELSRAAPGSFESLCRKRTLSKETRATVNAIREWAKKRGGSGSCSDTNGRLLNTSVIELEDKKLTNLAPLRSATQLRSLYLGGNSFASLADLANLKNVDLLDVRGSPLVEIPQNLLNGVRFLNISFTRISSLHSISGAPHLIELMAHGLGLESAEGVEKFERLFSLGLSENALEEITAITRLPGLQYLYLSNNKIKSVTLLRDVPSLRLLNIAENPLEDTSECPLVDGICVF
jgi:Leucine rich repeat